MSFDPDPPAPPPAPQPDRPLVSIVIPCFDQAHYLAEAVESALAQTFPPAEVIVIDDGSHDNSFEVAGRYPAVRRLRQPHGGVAAARNRGLTECGGECVVFLDADDRLLPHALEIGADALGKRPQVAFAAGMCRDVDVGGAVLASTERQPLVAQDHYLRLLQDCFIWSGSSIVYRRAVLRSLGGFDESLAAADDYDLYLRIARRLPVYCHDAVVTEYRRHGANTTRDSAIVLSSQLEVLRRQRPLLRDRRERAARREGVRRTRRRHGRALAAQAAREWRRRRRRRALADAGTLARRAPGSFARLLAGLS